MDAADIDIASIVPTKDGDFTVREARDGTLWVQDPGGQVIGSGLADVDEAWEYVIDYVSPPEGRTVGRLIL